MYPIMTSSLLNSCKEKKSQFLTTLIPFALSILKATVGQVSLIIFKTNPCDTLYSLQLACSQ